MIVMYKNDTKRVVQSNMVDKTLEWTTEECQEWTQANPGLTAVVVEDNPKAITMWYDESDQTLKSCSTFDFTVRIGDTEYTKPEEDILVIQDDGVSSVVFSGIDEGSSVYVDQVLVGIMDSSESFTFTSTEVGTYFITFDKFAYIDDGRVVEVVSGV